MQNKTCAKIASSNKLLKILGVIAFFLGIIEVIVTLFVSKSYSFDISHRMYFGMRSLEGIVPYLTEFDDKLPFTHHLFELPILAGGRYVYVVMSVIAACISACYLNSFCQRLESSLGDRKNRKQKHKGVYKYLSLIYLGSLLLTPFSLTQINTLAASSFLVGWCMILEESYMNNRRKKLKLVVISSFLLAIAISLRPYYGFCIIAAYIVESIFQRGDAKNGKCWQLRKKHILSLTGIMVCGIIINISPNTISQGYTEVVIDGIVKQSENIMRQNILTKVEYIVKSAGRNILIPGLFGISIIRLIAYIKTKKSGLKLKGEENTRLIFGWVSASLVMPIALIITFAVKHYWPYYITLLVPLGAISLAYGEITKKVYTQNRARRKLSKVQMICFVVAIAIIFISFSRTISTHVVLARELEKEKVREKVLDLFMRETGSKEFIFLNSMNQHARLKKGRDGFPHTANLGHIMDGHWENSTINEGYEKKIKNEETLCDELIKTRKMILFDRYFISKKCLERLEYKKEVRVRKGYYPHNRSSDIIIVLQSKEEIIKRADGYEQ